MNKKIRQGLQSILGSTLALAALLLTGCDAGSDHLRYRLVVEVDTPAGVRSGAGVIDARVESAPWWALAGNQVNFGGRGEAVAVDLPNGQTLFAVLSKPWFPDAFIRLPLDLFSAPLAAAELQRTGEVSPISQRVRQLMRDQPSAPVTGDNRPFLVRFRDINDPGTVEEVDPDQLSNAFGPGYHLRRITISITTDRVTTGIRDRLPWLTDHPDRNLRRPENRQDRTLPVLLRHGAFAIEI
jgi:hypothetical protein